MANPAKYERFLRFNYELCAMFAWVAGLMAAFWVCFHWDFPSVVFKVMGGSCAIMILWRGIPGARRYQSLLKVKNGIEKEYISWIKIAKVAKRKHNKVFLGKAFPWTQNELQKAADLMNRGNPKILHKSEGRWIHGLGPRNNKLFIESQHLHEHTLIVGTTGTGKSTLFKLVAEQAIIKGEPVLIFDPKGDPELSGALQEACQKVGDPTRFLYFSPAFPERSVRIDPLKNWHRATEPSSRVAELIPSETKSDPFQAFSWNVLNTIIETMVYLDNEPPNLFKLRRYVQSGVEDMVRPAIVKYFDLNWPGIQPKEKLGDLISQYKEKASKKPELAIDGLLSLHKHNIEHFHKMVASLIPLLSMLTSGSLRYLLSPTPIDGDPRPVMDLATIIEKGQCLYVALDSMPDTAVGGALGSILLADLTAAASARMKEMQEMSQGRIRKKKLPPVNILVDEAAEVVGDPTIQLLNKSRSALYRMVIATQTLADLEVRTGSKAAARKIIGNTNNWIILRVMDNETQKYFADALPKTVVRSMDIGYRSATKSEDPMEFTGTYTETLKETKSELVPPALLSMLPCGHYFCRIGAKGNIYKVRSPILSMEEQVTSSGEWLRHHQGC